MWLRICLWFIQWVKAFRVICLIGASFLKRERTIYYKRKLLGTKFSLRAKIQTKFKLVITDRSLSTEGQGAKVKKAATFYV